ncbi:HAD-IIIA family hydrolase [Chitinimonas sp. BJYL2]|uniref:HAD-IIIA family hydrolase n=1 Tax=Chitinimonas sp. BJYL2 TaxID=2976696 RepID=UPI0022B2E7FF|nr:HAD-IIIA family hydrolase [Chitinimonas sp. BJYL2]
MTRRFDLLIFDWDGTLADSTALITSSIQLAFADAGLPVPSRRDASFVIGYGLSDAMQHLAPQASTTQIARIVEAYKHHYLARDGEIALFEGVQDALAHYRQAGYQLAVATGKSRRGLDRVLDQTGLGVCFDATRCADECHSKPHPQMIEELLEVLEVDTSRAVMVGDTTHDLQMAVNANTASLAVSYGAHPREDLAAMAPLGLFDSFTELDSWLRKHG